MTAVVTESVLFDLAEVIPLIPRVIPKIHEAIPGDSRARFRFGRGDSQIPPLGGNRESARAGREAAHARHSCGADVLTGLDGHRCAFSVVLDVYLLSALGEVEVLRSGRRTYNYARGQIRPRNIWNIPGHIPSYQNVVLADHSCRPMPDTWVLPKLPPLPSQPAEEGIPF